MAGGLDHNEVMALLANDRPIAPFLDTGMAALALVGVGMLRERYQWLQMTDAQWDALELKIVELEAALMTNFMVGAILPFAGAIPANCLLCDGSTYALADYPALAAVIDSALVVGGNFTVPNLTNKFIRGGNIGNQGGADTHTLSESEMPAHTHSYAQYTYGVDIESVGVPDPTGVGQPALSQVTGSAGGGQAHNNIPAYYALAFAMVAY